MQVHGFNTSSKLVSRVVSLKLRDFEQPLSLICIPEIRTRMELPGLAEVVQQFTRKGYTLADKLLVEDGNTITDIGIIIGDNEFK